MGTVGYMSPEQVRGVPADQRSDIFSLSVVLCEALTGRPAFERPTSAETMVAILNEDPPALAEMAANIPPGLQRVLHRGLEKNPEQRFQSASDLAFALEALSDPSLFATSELRSALKEAKPQSRSKAPGWWQGRCCWRCWGRSPGWNCGRRSRLRRRTTSS